MLNLRLFCVVFDYLYSSVIFFGMSPIISAHALATVCLMAAVAPTATVEQIQTGEEAVRELNCKGTGFVVLQTMGLSWLRRWVIVRFTRHKQSHSVDADAHADAYVDEG